MKQKKFRLRFFAFLQMHDTNAYVFFRFKFFFSSLRSKEEILLREKFLKSISNIFLMFIFHALIHIC